MDEIDFSAATWTKSTYSGANGGNCLEVATWIKSTHSDANGGNCIEVAPGIPGVVPVRDSKNAEGPVLFFPVGDWSSFVTAVKKMTLS
ncbi:DUF397 domain-containing protein [Streptomyces sp. NRRL S-337]|uniref:DUF397 domain-containing protein n=1 Tax=Streptomyces sp. NRRL S-337 TaxID=1463900 RepID=UPI00099D65C1|nr:DUF397 domain-containing protein [Streptomyces sp. NRRL S-337]